MRILVTGCAGFIGSHLSERLIALGHEVVGVDCFSDYYLVEQKWANLRLLQRSPRFSLHELDLATADLRTVVEGIDLIYHQAGQPGVRASWGSQFDGYLQNNVLATQRLLEAVKDQPLRKFVYASSSSIYGDAESFPTTEAALPKPMSPYGATKLAAEHLTSLYYRNYGVPTIALRYFTVYGPRQRPDMAFHKFIRRALEDRPIEIYGDGNQTRDFTFVSDAVAANVAAGQAEAAGVSMNVGGGSQVSVNDVVGILEELLERPVRRTYLATERGDVRHTSADTSLAASLLGYKPAVDLREGLAAELSWIQGDPTKRTSCFSRTATPALIAAQPA
jgi:nucleoside-diphosphate-sugar epimerase